MTVQLEIERYGDDRPDAAPLLIAHGLFGSGRNWAGLAKRFAQHRAVATADLRNHGASPWAETMDYPAMGSDLAATAEAAFGRPAILLGHSMGGKAAMAAALIAPERLAGLIIADIAPVAYADHQHGRFIEAMRAADLSTATKRSEIDPQLAEAIPEAPLRAFILANLEFQETPEGRRAAWRLNLDAIAASMDALVGWPESLAGRRYEGASYFLHGGASDYVSKTGRAEIARAFPQAEIAAIEGAGHWLHAEKPEAFAAAVERWLAVR